MASWGRAYAPYPAPAIRGELQVLELMRCEFIDRRENVLLIGGSGTGKTHLATA